MSSILNDFQIAELCRGEKPMISPFLHSQMGSPSAGLSSFGYDIRVGNEFRIFRARTDDCTAVIDPTNFDPELVDTQHSTDRNRGHVLLPPHSFTLAASVERFEIPEDVLAICVGKSTYARCGLVVNVTPLEPGWRGILTLELSNTTPQPVKVYGGRGIAQLLFFRGKRPGVTYADRKGVYQDQIGITGPRGYGVRH